MTKIYDTARYTVFSQGNGATFRIDRKYDGLSVFLQGDDAAQFNDELDATHAGWSVNDVCSQYDNIMSAT